MRVVKHFFGLFMVLCLVGLVSTWQLSLKHPEAALVIGFLVALWFIIKHLQVVLMTVGVIAMVYLGFHL